MQDEKPWQEQVEDLVDEKNSTYEETVEKIMQQDGRADPMQLLADFFNINITVEALQKLNGKAKECFASGAGEIVLAVIERSHPELATKIKWEGLPFTITGHVNFSIGFTCGYIARWLDNEGYFDGATSKEG